MINIRIIRNWSFPDLNRQTPEEDGVWNGIRLTDEPLEQCDYLLLLSVPRQDVVVRCPPENVWLLCQEPPTQGFRAMHGGTSACRRVYTQDVTRQGPRFFHSQPALPWFVNRTYRWLRQATIPEKPRTLSWVTSNKAYLKGHRARMNFLERVSPLGFDLYGRGFREIEDKWDALAPYQYTLAVENFAGPYYFTEKLVDAFLSWTVPLYAGCTNLSGFFPREAYITIDITAADVPERIRDITSRPPDSATIDAIAEARRRVLEQLQLFPFMAAQVAADRVRLGYPVHGHESVVVRGTRLLLRRGWHRVCALWGR